jgi:hypothetical protein
MQIIIEKGKIRIPTALAITTLKPKMGAVKAKLQELFPDISWERDTWVTYVTPEAIQTVNRVFKRNFPIPEERGDVTISFPFKTEPMGHQHKALAVCDSREYFAYFMEPGTGKSKVTIDDMQILHRDRGLADVLILCPKSIKKTWVKEIMTHGYYETWDIWIWANNSKRSECVKIHDGGPNATMKWVIMNIDAIVYDHGYQVAGQALSHSGVSAMIIDESTTIKNIEATRTLRSLYLGNLCNYRRILSGTPMAHSPLDYYSQMVYLDQYIFHGWSFKAFKEHFCILGGYRRREIMGFINQAELAMIVSQHSFQAVKAECMDLPERVFQVREIEPSEGFWKVYTAIVNEVLLSVDGQPMTTQMVVQKIAKLRQLVGGWLLPDWEKDADDRPIRKGTRIASLIEEAKIEDLKGVLDEFKGSKGIIWCFFQHEVVNLMEICIKEGWNPVCYYGALSSKERDKNEEAFERGDADLFIAQVDTGGMGLTLNAASFMYYFNRPVYLLPRMQSLERNYRKGQSKCTTVIDAVIMGTIDETNLETLNSRQDLAERLTKASRDPEALSDLLIRRKKGKWQGAKKT